jgi:uncharacterized membrane protein
MAFGALILSLIALVVAYILRSRIGVLEDQLRILQIDLDSLRDRIGQLTREPRAGPAPAPTEAPIAPVEAVKQPPPPEAVPVKPAPKVEVPPPPKPVVPPPLIPPSPPDAAAPADQAPPKAPPPPRRPAPPVPPKPAFDWEGLIGVKLFSWIAGIALVFAAVFFLKYSVDQRWLGPPIRMAIGLVTGVALLIVCEWRAARRYSWTANALDAASIAILFSTFFAAYTLWDLLAPLPTFGLMAMVTALAVLLAIRHDSMFIALLGLVGGFATPALLSTGEDRPIGLFSYLLLLNAGLAWVAYRKRWPWLTVLSAIFTVFYQWGWVVKFLHEGTLPIAVGVFLVFPILTFVALALGQKRDAADAGAGIFRETSIFSIAAPLLFAVFLAATPAYGSHYGLMFAFLFIVDAGLLVVAAKRGFELLHLLGAVATVVTFCVWLQVSYDGAAWPAILGIVSAFVLLYLVGGFLRLGFSGVAQRAVFAAPLLLVVFPALAYIEPRAAQPGALFGVLFALMALVAAYAIAREEGAVHFLAAFFAVAAEAVWSSRHLTPDRLLPALAIYAIFGMFYLGAPIVAAQYGKRLRPEGSGAVVLFVSLGLLFFLAAGPVASAALWGIAILLAILNFGLLVEAMSGRHPLLLVAGLALSWIVIAVWWSAVSLAALLVPGLIAVAAFTLMILGGNIWAARRAEQEQAQATSVFGHGLYLALVGHAFLFFVAMQPSLSIPPWPFLGVLAVLDLAIGVAALYAKRGELHFVALAASQSILVLWETLAPSAPWPQTAIFVSLGVGGFGLAWFVLARRLGVAEADWSRAFFQAASAVAAFIGMAVVATASTLEGNPGVSILATATVAFVVLLLALDRLADWRFVAPASVVAAALVVFVWSLGNFTPGRWTDELRFAAGIYALFLSYPFWCGPTARRALGPYLAAVAAGVPFFLFARHALVAGGFADRIGLLPLTQALLMAGLLWKLLQLEPPGKRAMGRLAMVAGSVLAFVTVAIPLQLEKQWITIGWALLAAALAWLWRRIPHWGLLVWTSGLMAGVFIRLVFNPAVFEYHARGTTPIVNWYLYTYLVAAAAFFFVAAQLRDQKESIIAGLPGISSLAAAGGAILLFLLLNIEIADFYSTGPQLTFNFNADIAQDLTYTIGWGIFAFGLLTAGILLQSRAARVAAIGLLSVTVGKCFLHDLWRLGGLYRVGSFVGLAICLTLVALLLQKFVLRHQNEAS